MTDEELVAKLRDKDCCEAPTCNCDAAADLIEQLKQDLADMRDNAESAYRRGYYEGRNGQGQGIHIMPEIERKPLKLTDANGEEFIVFDQKHTLGDIVRWLMENKTDAEEVLYLLKEALGEEE